MLSNTDLQSSTRNHQLKFVGNQAATQPVHKNVKKGTKNRDLSTKDKKKNALHSYLNDNMGNKDEYHLQESNEDDSHSNQLNKEFDQSYSLSNQEKVNEIQKVNPSYRNIPIDSLPVKPVEISMPINGSEISKDTPKEITKSKGNEIQLKTHYQNIIDEFRPSSVQSEDSILFDNNVDIFKMDLPLENYTTDLKEYTAKDTVQQKKVLQIQLQNQNKKSNIPKVQTNLQSNKLENEYIESPTSMDSDDKFIPQSKNLTQVQPLKKRTPTYYRNLLSHDKPTDVSYLLDSELQDLTLNYKSGKRKLPPLSSKGLVGFKEKENITFPSILDQVLKMVGQPVTFNLAPSKIPIEYHIKEEFPIKNDQRKDAVFDQEKGAWVSQAFPSKIPASRVEVVHLARVFEEMLRDVKQTTKINSIDEISSITDILDAVGSEIIRQVHVHCGERGVLLKILIDSFQMINKQSLQFYHKAKQILINHKNESKTLMEKVGNLNALMSQKDSEINLYRNEIHELKMQLRNQNDVAKLLQTEKDDLISELQKLQEIQIRKSKQGPNKHIFVQTSIDSQKMDFLESKAINALNNEQARLEELRRAELAEQAAMNALNEAQEALRNAEASVKNNNIDNLLNDDDPYFDREIDKRLQTENLEVNESEAQTDPVKFQKGKKKIDRNFKYKSTSSVPKSPPNVTQPSMVPIVQPVPLHNEFEVRENRIDDNIEFDWISEQNASDEEDDLSEEHVEVAKPQHLQQPLQHQNQQPHQQFNNKSKEYEKSKNDTIEAVLKSVNSKKQRKVNVKIDKSKAMDSKLRTLASHDIFELFHDLIIRGKTNRIYSLRWINRYILDILTDLTDSDFLATMTDLRNIRKFVYDFHLVKFGLSTLAVQHLLDFLHNLKQHYKESSRVRIFIQFSVLSQWYGKDQQDIYTPLTLPLYLKALQLTKGILNKKALKELEDGTLFVSETFVYSLLERLKLPLSQDEQRTFFDSVLQQFEDGYIYFDDFMILLVAAYHKHEERRLQEELSINSRQDFQLEFNPSTDTQQSNYQTSLPTLNPSMTKDSTTFTLPSTIQSSYQTSNQSFYQPSNNSSSLQVTIPALSSSRDTINATASNFNQTEVKNDKIIKENNSSEFQMEVEDPIEERGGIFNINQNKKSNAQKSLEERFKNSSTLKAANEENIKNEGITSEGMNFVIPNASRESSSHQRRNINNQSAQDSQSNTNRQIFESTSQIQSIPIDQFNSTFNNYFGTLFTLNRDDTGFPTSVTMKNISSKKELIQSYIQSQKSIKETINLFPKSEVKAKFLETNSNLYRIVTELEFEEAIVHYRNFICVLLREKGDSESLILSKMLITLFKNSHL